MNEDEENEFVITWTRKQYMRGECTHRQYYGQFLDRETSRRVLLLGDPAYLAEQMAKDEHFNGISLDLWDLLASIPWPRRFVYAFREAGESISLMSGVCLLKEQARQLAEAYSVCDERSEQ